MSKWIHRPGTFLLIGESWYYELPTGWTATVSDDSQACVPQQPTSYTVAAICRHWFRGKRERYETLEQAKCAALDFAMGVGRDCIWGAGRYFHSGAEDVCAESEGAAMKFRKKPVVIEAVQWRGNNLREIRRALGASYQIQRGGYANRYLLIQTEEGTMTANRMDFIIRGVKGEFYPVKADIFAQTYEAVDDAT